METRAGARTSSFATFAPNLLALVLPATVTCFTLTGPHSFTGALPYLGVHLFLAWIESLGRPARRQQQPPGAAAWPFDLLLYALVTLYFVNHYLLLRMAAAGGFWRFDTVVVFVFFGGYSAGHGIVMAHELIHRRHLVPRTIGRVMCWSILYDHFAIEHVRGHHHNVATPGDPTSARFGESYWSYFKRAVPAEWKSAFAIAPGRVLVGTALELALVAAIACRFGAAALGVFLVQAVSGVRYLEAVNYFQHWGLTRTAQTQRTIDSWDINSPLSLYTIFALSRHADHHLHPVRPYQQLVFADDSPKLKRGFLGTILAVLYANGRFRAQMTKELERRRLGPFAAAPSEQVAHLRQ